MHGVQDGLVNPCSSVKIRMLRKISAWSLELQKYQLFWKVQNVDGDEMCLELCVRKYLLGIRVLCKLNNNNNNK